jgi:3-methyladenine DNA glycosylase AlkD
LDEKKKYLDHMKKYLESINHWNLVDGIADIFGDYAIETNDNNYLYTLHNSKSIWHKRIATVSQIKLIKLDKLDIAIEFVQDDIENKHEYIQKANGWILREIGKKDEKKLINFLKENISVMPSVTKSYATERIRKIYDMKTLFNKIK